MTPVSPGAMRVWVSTPSRALDLGGVTGLRFATHDGWRGVRPGHEPGRASLRSGPLRYTVTGPAGADRDPVRWLATEGGVVVIDRFELRILTGWVAAAASLAELRGLVEARDAERARIEEEAHALGHRHELATRRALMALERKVAMP